MELKINRAGNNEANGIGKKVINMIINAATQKLLINTAFLERLGIFSQILLMTTTISSNKINPKAWYGTASNLLKKIAGPYQKS